MGHMRHNAIVVSSWKDALIEEAHDEAVAIFNAGHGVDRQFDLVTQITEPSINGYRTFLVAPDGSKEGWSASDEFDTRRDKFVEWMESKRYEDGSTSLTYVEVQFADDDRETKIVRDSDSARTAA